MQASRPAWWCGRGWPAWAWLPLSLIFRVLSGLRRQAYRLGWLHSEQLPVPVVVVGNIAVGGSGKTPVVQWLAQTLRSAGWHPGIVSRGYGGQVEGAALVPEHALAGDFGDEPVLLASSCACPVAVGADRVAAARLLLAAHPECKVLISDDGLQHYRMRRDVELVVVDEAVLGNGWLLPAGPLREGVGRLRQADLVLTRGAVSPLLQATLAGVPHWPMRLLGDRLLPVGVPGAARSLAAFAGRTVHALAGIGRPEGFFEQLRAAGLRVIPHAFPDHHRFVPADLALDPPAPRIMTAKDAVKCAPFALPDCWMLPVEADIPAAAAQLVVEKLRHGRSTA